MTRATLMTSTTLVLLLCAHPAFAQQKPDEKASHAERNAPHQNAAPRGNSGVQKAPRSAVHIERNNERQSNRVQREAQHKSTDSARRASEDKRHSKSRSAEDGARARIRTTEDRFTPKNQKQGAARAQSSDAKGKAHLPSSAENKNTTSGKSATNTEGGSAKHIQLSEQQRTNLSDAIHRDARANRLTKVNFSLHVGTRVPRRVRLEGLPPRVVALVPEYRGYRYLVADDEICIVEPTTYEIVEVIPDTGSPIGIVALVLTATEEEVILREINVREESTLGLGVMTEGADVPRSVQVHGFPEAVVTEIPKLRNYKYFTAENRIAIVDPSAAKVRLVINGHR
jgi:hypothetical protein